MGEGDGAESLGLDPAKLEAFRRALRKSTGVSEIAYSTDGKTFGFQAPLSRAIPVGGYVRLRTEEGVEYLGQVIGKEVTAREGAQLDIDVDLDLGRYLEGGRVRSAAVRPEIRYVRGTGNLLARAADGGISPTTPADVFDESEIEEAPVELVAAYLAADRAREALLRVGGSLHAGMEASAFLRSSGFNRHSFLCGQSGSGKTYSMGVVLERILMETSLRLIIVDPNSDFVRLGNVRRDAEDRSSSEAERYRDAVAGIRVYRPTPPGGGTDELRLRFSDLNHHHQGAVLKLDPLESREEYNAFWRIVERLPHERYSLSDVREVTTHDLSPQARQLGLRIENLGIAGWGLWADREAASLIDALDGDDRLLVMDVAGLASPSEKSVVAMAILDHLWRRREERRPVLVVIDEAHNVCPQEPADALQAISTQQVVQIAGEGRKYGIYLLLATQRPEKIEANVLSQCENLVLLRMNSAADLAHIGRVFSFVPAPILGQASHFSQGEALVAGRIVDSPALIKIGTRLSEEGGGDVPTNWAERA